MIKNLLHRAYDLEATTNNYFLKVQTALPSDVSQQVYLDEREVRRLGEVRVDSDEERELQEVNNKLGALRRAVEMAEKI